MTMTLEDELGLDDGQRRALRRDVAQWRSAHTSPEHCAHWLHLAIRERGHDVTYAQCLACVRDVWATWRHVDTPARRVSCGSHRLELDDDGAPGGA